MRRPTKGLKWLLSVFEGSVVEDAQGELNVVTKVVGQALASLYLPGLAVRLGSCKAFAPKLFRRSNL